MAEFSMELNEDQLQLQKWIHEFGVDVIRPAAEEWDEREEFPWPVVEEAAKIGLYGWEFMAEMMMNDPTGLSMVTAIEEIFWADA
ncbi:MAG: acyl-CoA dehydrogenase family protein, partial [Acidimicrobiales bacterium]